MTLALESQRSRCNDILDLIDVITERLAYREGKPRLKPTKQTIVTIDGVAYCDNKREQRIKLVRHLSRNLKALNNYLADDGLQVAIVAECELSDLAASQVVAQFTTSITSDVKSAYNRGFYATRMAALAFMVSKGIKPEHAYNLLTHRFPLASCMVAREACNPEYGTHNIRKPHSRPCNPVGLYNAINDGAHTVYKRERYTVNVESVSGFALTKPTTKSDCHDITYASLPMFRVLVWTLTPDNVALPTIRMVDKIYTSHSDERTNIVRYLQSEHGVTHEREHHGLTDCSDGETVCFKPLTPEHKHIGDLTIVVDDVSLREDMPYVDSFKYAIETTNGMSISLTYEGVEDHEVRVLESTSGGTCDWYGESGGRCENCGDFYDRDELMYSERLEQSMCDSCYCECLAHCDSCSSEIATQSDTYYTIPCGSIACDSCVTQH